MKKIMVCSVCGLKIEKDGEIDSCLKCGADSSKFKELSDDQAKKIYDADRTNDIYCRLIAMSMEISKLCEEGLDMALDPNCVKVFGWVKDRAWDTKQLCKAEIGGHVKGEKW